MRAGPIMAGMVVGLLVLGALALAGCTPARPPLSQTQIDALQVREIEAAQGPTFNAVTNALLDSGYQVMVSDPDAGILTAQKRIDPAPAADTAVITGTILASIFTGQYMVQDLPPEYRAVSAVIGASGAARSWVRLQTFVDGLPILDEELVKEMWVLVQRQVMMKEPLPASSPAP